jgi:hypothetical protein
MAVLPVLTLALQNGGRDVITCLPISVLQIVEAGESLALFASADFGERSNSSRAINTKDYAHLLKVCRIGTQETQ